MLMLGTTNLSFLARRVGTKKLEKGLPRETMTMMTDGRPLGGERDFVGRKSCYFSKRLADWLTEQRAERVGQKHNS